MAPNYAKHRYCSHQLNVCLTRASGELKSKHITSERAEHSRGWGEMQALGLMKHQYLLFHLPHIRVPKYRALGAVLYEQKLSLKNTLKEFPWKTVPHTNEGNWRIQCNVIVLFLNDGMKTGVEKNHQIFLGNTINMHGTDHILSNLDTEDFLLFIQMRGMVTCGI